MVSAAVAAVRASDLAWASFALPFWFRNDGMAIAARMPMIRITTRSSISVKPPSSPERWRSRYSIEMLLGILLLGRQPSVQPSPVTMRPPGIDLAIDFQEPPALPYT